MLLFLLLDAASLVVFNVVAIVVVVVSIDNTHVCCFADMNVFPNIC